MATGRRAFWSYVHRDDETEQKRISQLADDVVETYSMVTGEEIQWLVVDKNFLIWGDDWGREIADQLDSVEFFIPVMTPRYFRSLECRRELTIFLNKVTQRGRRESVLPLYYLDIPELNNHETDDELVREIESLQRFDWRDLRLKDRDSEAYRTGVDKLVRQLIEVNKKFEENPPPLSPPPEADGRQRAEDDEPGIVDRLAASEEAAEEFSKTLTTITHEIETIGEIMTEGAARVKEDAPRGFSHRRQVIQQTSAKLASPIQEICTLTNSFESQLHLIDDGIRLFVELGQQEVENDPNAKEHLCSYFEAVLGMSESSRGAFESLREMMNTLSGLENMSRDLRPTLRRLRKALEIMLKGKEKTESWPHLIERSGIDCSE